TFTRSRADAPGEIGEVIGLVEPFEGFLPQTAIDKVVPLRDKIVNRATGGHAVEERSRVTEGNPAVHAACALLAKLVLGHVLMDFLPIGDAFERGSVQRQFT